MPTSTTGTSSRSKTNEGKDEARSDVSIPSVSSAGPLLEASLVGRPRPAGSSGTKDPPSDIDPKVFSIPLRGDIFTCRTCRKMYKTSEMSVWKNMCVHDSRSYRALTRQWKITPTFRLWWEGLSREQKVVWYLEQQQASSRKRWQGLGLMEASLVGGRTVACSSVAKLPPGGMNSKVSSIPLEKGTFACKTCLRMCKASEMSSRKGVCVRDHNSYKCLTGRWKRTPHLRVWWRGLSRQQQVEWYLEWQRVSRYGRRRLPSPLQEQLRQHVEG